MSSHPNVGAPFALPLPEGKCEGYLEFQGRIGLHEAFQIDHVPVLEDPIGPVGGIGPVRGPFQVGQPQEGLIQLVVLGKVQDGPVQANEDGDLDERRQAPRERIHIVLLVQLGDPLVHHLRIALILGLQLLDGGLDRLHLVGALELRLGERERKDLDDDGHHDDADPPRIGGHPDAHQGAVYDL